MAASCAPQSGQGPRTEGNLLNQYGFNLSTVACNARVLKGTGNDFIWNLGGTQVILQPRF